MPTARPGGVEGSDDPPSPGVRLWVRHLCCAIVRLGMCLICIDIARGALRPVEGRRALREMRDSLPPGHAQEVERKLAEAERDELSQKKP